MHLEIYITKRNTSRKAKRNSILGRREYIHAPLFHFPFIDMFSLTNAHKSTIRMKIIR
jgi:hypothetical protein